MHDPAVFAQIKQRCIEVLVAQGLGVGEVIGFFAGCAADLCVEANVTREEFDRVLDTCWQVHEEVADEPLIVVAKELPR